MFYEMSQQHNVPPALLERERENLPPSAEGKEGEDGAEMYIFDIYIYNLLFTFGGVSKS